MGLSAKKAYGAAKAYTDETVIGGGALKGKNCVITSITDISATSSHPAGKRVNFGWTLDDGTEQSAYMDIYNGNDGEGIDHMYVNAEGHLIVVYDSGDEEDCGEITIPSSQADWNETDPTENSYIQNKPNISAIIDAVGNNTNAIGAINQQLSAVISGVSDNTSAIASINQQLSTVIAGVSNNTSAINTINRDLEARANIKSIGTGLNLDSSGELTATGGGGGTSDYADLTNKPSINNVTLSGNKTSADLGFGTASALNVASSGDASSTEVVKGDDTRLTDSRNAADVYSWAKEATKPSYTASEVGAIASTEKGANSGVAELDTNGKVPSAQLPSYVDDVVEYASTSAFPVTGESGKIYIALDTNKTYRWGGSEYVEISESLALGETASTAYAGNKGKANADAISAIKDGQTIDSFSDVETALSGKADKVSGATNGNFAGLDSNGNLTDSGSKASDFLTSHQDISGKADLADLAPAFSTSTSYYRGEYVTYEGDLYRCTSGHSAGAWDANDFTQVTVGGDLYSHIPENQFIGGTNSQALFRPKFNDTDFVDYSSHMSFSPALTHVDGYVYSALKFGVEYTVTMDQYYGMSYGGWDMEYETRTNNSGDLSQFEAMLFNIFVSNIHYATCPVIIPFISKEGYAFALKMYDFNEESAVQTFKMKVDYINGFSSTIDDFFFIKTLKLVSSGQPFTLEH